MGIQLKSLHEQVIVVTGASSGIGRATAKEAAARGARVLLAARDEESLREAVEEIRAEGGTASYEVADVSNEQEVKWIVEAALRDYGGFDTWVNNAGVTVFGKIEEQPIEDVRRLFDVNYWGVVHGSLAALPHLRERGGALINVGSVLSDRAIPLQGHYSASKHAVKGFTEALRMELEKDDAPVSVTLVKPSSIATPYPQHAKNYMDAEPTLPPPVYAPEVVARTICACAEKPVREITVGAGGRFLADAGSLMPWVMDKYMEHVVWDQQKREQPGGDGAATLHEPVPGSGRVHGDFENRHVLNSSLYTTLALRPNLSLIGLAALGLGLGLAAFRR